MYLFVFVGLAWLLTAPAMAVLQIRIDRRLLGRRASTSVMANARGAGNGRLRRSHRQQPAVGAVG